AEGAELVELRRQFVEERLELSAVAEQSVGHGWSDRRSEQSRAGHDEVAPPEGLGRRSLGTCAHPRRAGWRPGFAKCSDGAGPSRTIETTADGEFVGERGEDRVERAAGPRRRISDR